MHCCRLNSSIAIFVLLLLAGCNCNANNSINYIENPFGYSDEPIIMDFTPFLKDGVYVIKDTIDLKGRTLVLPENIILRIDGGLFKNGVLFGNNTTLNYKRKSVVFDRVNIKGTWIIGVIRSTMFSDLSYDNALKDVIALTNSAVRNRVFIDKGIYKVNVYSNSDVCLPLTSNTDLQLDGDVFLTPNIYSNYSIIETRGSNIRIKGKGAICGDKQKHLANEGEWGMGVFVRGGTNISIKGITIKDCWGDCIYITGDAANVIVEDCLIDNGRRQGISVIYAQNVTIKNSKIQNIEGTKPEYAIDIEPNKNCFVNNVQIKNVIIENCKGGIASYGAAEGAKIDSIIVKNCSINKTTRCPINLTITRYVRVENSQINRGPKELALNFEDVKSLIISRIEVDGKRISGNKNIGKNVKINNVDQYVFK